MERRPWIEEKATCSSRAKLRRKEEMKENERGKWLSNNATFFRSLLSRRSRRVGLLITLTFQLSQPRHSPLIPLSYTKPNANMNIILTNTQNVKKRMAYRLHAYTIS